MDQQEKFILVQLVLLSLLLPTLDTFSDLVLCLKLFLAGHPLWSLAVGLPVAVTSFFTLAAWKRCPKTLCSKQWWWLEWGALLFQVINMSFSLFHQNI